ncbi:DUF305 domain-containing protein [Streptomyces phaeoluteigriseus]|uniref:DUF305 domain-containing protein n=1 Tax=Streptomyces phaeoluteigriseus TaxID=114686 RepID=A0A1V6MXP0_9ACTN|nr:DUF305 domain-containing protein [Streptomyces phaeoluteigriseus]
MEVVVPVRRAPLVAVALSALVLTGCDSGSDTGSGAAAGPSVIAPGKPGEANRTLSAQDAAEQRVDDDTPNSADIDFARMMIEHHRQALEMTGLAPKQAESAKLKALASRITAAQGPEIQAMESWLATYSGKDGDAGGGTGGGHEHAATGMPGMATEAQLKKLRAARGKAFDQLFLTLMITHHEGAITMAADVKAQGNNVRIEEMADDVVAEQTTEITRMRAML